MADLFRLKEGKRHYHDGTLIKPGDVVELTPAQRLSFADKFDKVDQAVPPASPPKEPSKSEPPKSTPPAGGKSDTKEPDAVKS